MYYFIIFNEIIKVSVLKRLTLIYIIIFWAKERLYFVLTIYISPYKFNQLSRLYKDEMNSPEIAQDVKALKLYLN